MSYIDAIAKGIASKVSSGKLKIGTINLRHSPHKDLRGRHSLAPGTKSAGCTKDKHYQCYSLSCVCECHKKLPIKPDKPHTAQHRAAIARGVKLAWAKRKQSNKTKES